MISCASASIAEVTIWQPWINRPCHLHLCLSRNHRLPTGAERLVIHGARARKMIEHKVEKISNDRAGWCELIVCLHGSFFVIVFEVGDGPRR